MSSQILGMQELQKGLKRLEKAAEIKQIRKALRKATTPTVNTMKAIAPKGTESHKTYKGRVVAPSFLKRSIIRTAKKSKTGGLILRIGVRREAFYGVLWLDKGLTVTKRKGKAIKPYAIKGTNWFLSVFNRDKQRIFNSYQQELLKGMRKG